MKPSLSDIASKDMNGWVHVILQWKYFFVEKEQILTAQSQRRCDFDLVAFSLQQVYYIKKTCVCIGICVSDAA